MKIDPDKCPQNHKCPAIAICPVGAITQTGNSLPEINQKTCIDCGRCISFCPRKAFHR
ncbi:MAG TPA: 4Fe-4S binding protein [Spirochaetota bacterium]|nr:4Fe-4S binding protein [Spirochaetota bacterium]